MPRRKRIVIPDIPHHVTQRGMRRQNVFFDEQDRHTYLELLRENALRYGTEVVAYCLMSNHVHHLLVPLESDSLRWTLQLTHKRYADYLNGKNGWSGHVWQERFYSSPVDEHFFWVALRYIEQNPSKAGLVSRPVDYPWSSAAAHCGLRDDTLLTTSQRWISKKSEIRSWRDWLLGEDRAEVLQMLRKNTFRDLPTGSSSFLDDIEVGLGVSVRPPRLGRPPRERPIVPVNGRKRGKS